MTCAQGRDVDEQDGYNCGWADEKRSLNQEFPEGGDSYYKFSSWRPSHGDGAAAAPP
jgi:hypothetical protein